ncbi:MAG: DUF4956 domain-containing protein [Oscillospiraceae bacterium]|nr:DUF4956 domain-containing protein [Oscillospiraceae bacterium]
MLESIYATSAGDVTITLPTLLAALGVAFAVGLLISFVYIKTHANKSPSQSFALTLVLLPAVVTIIILLVGNNVARAFSLAGAFSIIRFRSAPGDAKDITFVLFSMAVGLAAGMGFLLYAVVAGVLLCAVVALLEVCKFGKSKSTAKTLKIIIPENLDYQGAFDDIFSEFAQKASLLKIKTTELGSLFELTYSVTARSDYSEKDFIDALRTRNGNLNITLALAAPTDSEF